MEKKNKVLIVSSISKSTEFIISGLDKEIYSPIDKALSASEAKKKLSEENFDIVIINAPLSDEFGESFAETTVKNHNCSVMIVVKKDLYAKISTQAENAGILCVSKPISKEFFTQSVRFMIAVNNRIKMLGKRTETLKTEVETTKLISRAKCLLIEKLAMSESEAHKYIEKQAMDLCVKKTEIAKRIIVTYEI